MPQQSLLPNHPPMTALRVEFRYPPPGSANGHLQVWVAAETGHGEMKSVWVGQLPDLQADLAMTMAEDLTATFLFGETRRDLARTAAGVKRAAQAHEAACTY